MQNPCTHQPGVPKVLIPCFLGSSELSLANVNGLRFWLWNTQGWNPNSETWKQGVTEQTHDTPMLPMLHSESNKSDECDPYPGACRTPQPHWGWPHQAFRRAGDTDVRSVEVILEGLGSYVESTLELVSTQGLGCFQGAPSIHLITNWKDRINFHLLLVFISKCLWKGFNLICFCRQSRTSLLWTPDLIIRLEICGTLIVLGW